MSGTSRGDLTDRIVRLWRLAEAGPLPQRADLARELGVHVRTVSRILRVLERYTPVRWQSDEISDIRRRPDF